MLSTRCLRHFERLAVPLRCMQLEGRYAASSPKGALGAFPLEQRRTITNTIDHAPAAIRPILQYASYCLPTESIQTAIEGEDPRFHLHHDFLSLKNSPRSGLQSTGLPPVAAYVVMGLSLRVACLPLHVYAEQLLSKRIEITKAIGTNIMQVRSKRGIGLSVPSYLAHQLCLVQKVGEHYKVPVVVDSESGKTRLDTQERKIHKHAMELVGL